MKKLYFKPIIIFTVVLLTIIFFSQVLHFAPSVCAEDDSTGGLVPCNNKCTLCHVLVGLQNIFKYLMGLLFVAAMFFVTLNGALMMVSAGSKKIVGQVKTALGLCLKGFLLFLICWVIITGIMRTLGYKQLANWWQFDCDTTQTVGPTTPITPITPTTPKGPFTPGKLGGSVSGIPLVGNARGADRATPELVNLLGNIKNQMGSDVYISSLYRPQSGNSSHAGGRYCEGVTNGVDLTGPDMGKIAAAAIAAGADTVIYQAKAYAGGKIYTNASDHYDHVHVSVNNKQCGADYLK